MTSLQLLKERLTTLAHVSSVNALMQWDQSTYMPPRGLRARAQQTGTLHSLYHSMLVSVDIERLLSASEDEVAQAGLPPENNDVCLLRVVRREFRIASCLSNELVSQMAEAATYGYSAWMSARANNSFEEYVPSLTRAVEMARKQADLIGYEVNPYDALLDLYEPNMTTSRLKVFFNEIRDGLQPILDAVLAQPSLSLPKLAGTFEASDQMRLVKSVTESLGFDYSRGRIDLSAHPFATSFTRDDVRLTTRINPASFVDCLTGSVHETGHGLYEQNVPAEMDGTLLAAAPSLGLHESQSRLWENVIGRSRPFCDYLLPLVRDAFPNNVGDLTSESLYRLLNAVAPTEIRVESDEVTYNLHIMIRFELEQKLINGELQVAEVNDAWNAATKTYLGFTPSGPAMGVLQDMHWSGLSFGYFPTYSIGNVLSVQLYESALQDLPHIPEQVAQGNFASLLSWLRENVHAYGNKFLPDEVMARATGRTLDSQPYLAYLRNKYSDLYGLPL